LDANFRGFFILKCNEQFKLAVVQQYLSGAAGYKTIAQSHNLLHLTVRNWVDLYREQGMDGFAKKFSYYSAEFCTAEK